MSYKKLLQEYSPQKLAESFVFPVKLSARQQKVRLTWLDSNLTGFDS